MNGTTMLTSRIRCLLALLSVCCVLGFVSCSNGEEDIDDVLSKETTPVTFELGSGNHILFDYTANGTYVGSDTINLIAPNTTATIKLRQGKHQIIWITKRMVRPNSSNNGAYSYYGEIDGLNFSPSEKTIQIDYLEGYDIQYWQEHIEVSLLQSVQKAKYAPAACALHIDITDFPPSIEQQSEWLKEIGEVFLPCVSEVGLADKRYKLKPELCIKNVYYYPAMMGTHKCRPIDYYGLCPLDGLNDIQPTCKATDDSGQAVLTTQLPKISLRRGYVTNLSGPIFSGSTADWKVEMIPFNYAN